MKQTVVFPTEAEIPPESRSAVIVALRLLRESRRAVSNRVLFRGSSFPILAPEIRFQPSGSPFFHFFVNKFSLLNLARCLPSYSVPLWRELQAFTRKLYSNKRRPS